MPEALLRPLLANTMYLVDAIGPHLAIEAAAARAADVREAQSRRGLLLREIDELHAAIEHRRLAAIPAYRAAPQTVSRRLKTGWAPHDPLLELAWHPLVVEVAGAMGHRRNLEILRPELERWAAECGITEPWCRTAALVARPDTGELVPWARTMARRELEATIYAVTSACFYLTSALSGMCASELVELTAGCRRQEQRPGGGARFRLVTRKIMGEEFGGVEDTWVVIRGCGPACGGWSAATPPTRACDRVSVCGRR